MFVAFLLLVGVGPGLAIYGNSGKVTIDNKLAGWMVTLYTTYYVRIDISSQQHKCE